MVQSPWQIPQLIEEEKLGDGVLPEDLLQRAVDLRRGEHVDHVHDAGEADGDAFLAGRVAQGIQEMGFARARGADEDGAAVLGHEVAVEQPQDGLLGDAFGEVEVVLLERLALRQTGTVNPPFQGVLPTDGDFFAHEGDQHVEHGTSLAGRLVEHLLIQLGDAVEL